MPEKVPLWIIRNTFCSYGSKMPPRPDTINKDAKQCATCKKWLNTISEWDYWQGSYYCREHYEKIKIEKPYVCSYGQGGYFPRPVESQLERISRVCGINEAGNLEETMYKFWIGEKSKASLRSTCRACGEVVYGSDMRTEHIENSKSLYKADVSCCFTLGIAHKKLMEKHTCAVCNMLNYNRQKWGVPLCSLDCIQVWKFDHKKVYPEIDRILQPMWKEQKTGGLITLASSLSLTPIALPPAEEE